MDFISQLILAKVLLLELLDAYVEENGGDMPTNDSHPAHLARTFLSGEGSDSMKGEK